jgi:hypothetical protein
MSLEPSESEDSGYLIKIFYHVCEQNGNAKCPATPFSAACEVGQGRWGCWTHMPTELVRKAIFLGI